MPLYMYWFLLFLMLWLSSNSILWALPWRSVAWRRSCPTCAVRSRRGGCSCTPTTGTTTWWVGEEGGGGMRGRGGRGGEGERRVPMCTECGTYANVSVWWQAGYWKVWGNSIYGVHTCPASKICMTVKFDIYISCMSMGSVWCTVHPAGEWGTLARIGRLLQCAHQRNTKNRHSHFSWNRGISPNSTPETYGCMTEMIRKLDGWTPF